jgi:hypothetical protein
MARRSSSQGEKIPFRTCTEGEGVISSLRVCGFGGFQFRDPWVSKLATHAWPSKVDRKYTTDQLIKSCMIGALEDEREGA